MATKGKPNRRNSKSVTVTVDAAVRAKDYLDLHEVDALLAAAKGGRYPKRDRALVLVMFRHGLRVSEFINLRLPDLDLKNARLYVTRLKNGLSTHQPVAGDELRAIRAYLSTRGDKLPWLFVSERGTPMTRQGITYLLREMGARACLPGLHPHMLRHSCGYALANKGEDSCNGAQ